MTRIEDELHELGGLNSDLREWRIGGLEGIGLKPLGGIDLYPLVKTNGKG